MSTTEHGLADIRARINVMKSNVSSCYAALRAIGIPTPTPAKLEMLPQTLERLAAGTTVNVLINQTGSDYQLPSGRLERDVLLNGAKVYVYNLVGEKLGEGTVAALENCNVVIQIPEIYEKTYVKVTLHLGGATYSAMPISTYIDPGRITACYFYTKANLGAIEEIGRFQFKSDATGTNYLIRRITLPDGTVNAFYGGYYIDGTATAVWQNHSGIYTKKQKCADASSEVIDEIVVACSDEGARDIMETLKVFRNMRPVTVTSTDAVGESVVNKMIQYEKFCCKTERAVIPIVTYNEDGTIASTQDKEVIIKWMCDTKADGGYHAHPMFVRSVRNSDGTYTDTELDHAFYSRYPMNWATIHHTASATSTVAVCTNDGICPETAVSRANAQTYATNLNKIACEIVDDETGDTIATLAANEDARAFAPAGSADISFFQWVCVMLYGINIQSVIAGKSTTDAAQTKNGETDWLFEKGILFGSANNSQNTQPCIIAGIEDGIHSSQGTFMNDLTYFAERTYDAGTGTEGKRAYLVYARDRLDWKPAQGTLDTLLANGYRKLAYDLNSNTDASNTTISNVRKRLGVDLDFGGRDVMIPAADQDADEFQVAAVDYFYFGTTPAVGAAIEAEADVRSAYLVALGGSRRSGSYLGLFWVDAAGALSYANASSWRPRLSLQVVGV